jgi:hypothetical protein
MPTTITTLKSRGGGGGGGGGGAAAAKDAADAPARRPPTTIAPRRRRPPPPPPPPRHRHLAASSLLVALAALAAYANSLGNAFVYDDFYAVVNNADVTPQPVGLGGGSGGSTTTAGPLTPLRQTLRHDFWGQPMTSDQSHKSYRPLTVLSFRFTRWMWEQLAGVGGGGGDWPPWIDPWPFHALGLGLHCLASVLVLSTALWLFEKRLMMGGQAAALDPLPPALATALLFALHPIHTEAVAGIVGTAEPLAASLALAALQLFGLAADECGGRGAHWPLICGALLLALLSALAKEVGVSVLGSMVLYDVLLALPPPTKAGTGALRRRQRLQQLQRALACALALALYVGLRVLLGGDGDHLVRIFRRVENPLAFLDSAATPSSTPPPSRLFSLLHLHALYAGLLAFPVRLSADWSFECVPMTPAPWRLLGAWEEEGAGAASSTPRLVFLLHHASWIALYGLLAAVLAAARPLELAAGLAKEWWRALRAAADGGDDDDADNAPPLPPPPSPARWRLFVTLALVVAPFSPASNVFFYVGTYIAERLLYLPSVGFCLLLADWLWVVAPSASASSSPPARRPRATVALATTATLLLLYGVRTVIRNRDWRDEPALFASALRVCPRSAKALLNAGVLARRKGEGEGEEALRFFARAQAIDPTYCEPSYWIGLTLAERGIAEWAAGSKAVAALRAAPSSSSSSSAALSSAASRAARRGWRDLERGLAELRQGGVRCKYVAVQSVQALNRLYLELQQGAGAWALPGAGVEAAATGAAADTAAPTTTTTPKGPAELLAEWAGVLADPAVSRPGEACAAYEDAALAVATRAAEPFALLPSPLSAEDGSRRAACVASLLDRCLEALARAERGEVAPGSLAETNLQRWRRRAGNGNGGNDDDDNGRAVARASGDAVLLRDGAAALRRCASLRRDVYVALAWTLSPASLAAKRALYAYLDASAGGCRVVGAAAGTAEAGAGAGGDDPPQEASSSSSFSPPPHQRLVHALQAADPADPWLQAEWAEALLAQQQQAAAGAGGPSPPPPQDRRARRAAAKHFEAAAMLLLRHVEAVATVKGGRSARDPPPPPDPRPSAAADDAATTAPPRLALRFAAEFLRRRLDVLAGDDQRDLARCALHQRMCHAHFHRASLAGRGDEEEEDEEDDVDAALAAGRRCARALSKSGRCANELNELRRAVQF